MEDLRRFPIFRDITEDSIRCMMDCFRARQETYLPGVVIRTYDGATHDVGLLVDGAADLVRIDYSGTRTILEHLEPGGLFGEVLAFTVQTGDSVSVVSDGCAVLYMDYSQIMRRCENACAYHSRLVQNLFALVTDQMRRMGQRVEILSRRSIREKLLCYFSLRASGEASFELPFSLSALADYIGSDRSAMMRELKKLREEGVVTVSGRKVTLGS